MKITLLTFGTRGDVQPYLALGVGLLRQGHQVQVITAKNFGPWVQRLGLHFTPLNVDILQFLERPAGEILRAGKKISAILPRAVRELYQTLRAGWAAVAAFRPDVIVHHPKTLSGYSLAEKLGCALWLAAPTPLFSPTQAFPSPILPLTSLGPFNRLSHQLVLFATYVPYRQLLNAWRKTVLDLPPLVDERYLHGRPVPHLYPYSAQVLPRPQDWATNTHVTGYWWLEAEAEWQPPAALVNFLRAGPPPLYVGLGSMPSTSPTQAAKVVQTVLHTTQQRIILDSRWEDLPAVRLPPNVFKVQDIPHTWLFPQMAALVHHGGAGTTGQGLWAGKPILVCPFLEDQWFWGRRVHALEVGPKPIPPKQLTVENLTAALTQMTTPVMRQAAQILGQRLQLENGVARASHLITW